MLWFSACAGLREKRSRSCSDPAKHEGSACPQARSGARISRRRLPHRSPSSRGSVLRAVPVRGRGKASGPGRWQRGEGFAPAAVPGASGPYLSSLLRPPHAKPEGKAGTRDLSGEGGTERPPSPPEKRRQAPGVSQSGTAEARLGPGAPLPPTPASLPWGSRPSPRLAGSPAAPQPPPGCVCGLRGGSRRPSPRGAPQGSPTWRPPPSPRQRAPPPRMRREEVLGSPRPAQAPRGCDWRSPFRSAPPIGSRGRAGKEALCG